MLKEPNLVGSFFSRYIDTLHNSASIYKDINCFSQELQQNTVSAHVINSLKKRTDIRQLI